MRRILLAAVLGTGTTFAAFQAGAATIAAYDQAAFAAAQSQDQPILIEVTAPWCPVCAKQKPILEKITTQPGYAGLKIYTVDFDSQKAVLKQMGVQMQSTLITFRGAKELARSTGVTSEDAIRTQLDAVKG